MPRTCSSGNIPNDCCQVCGRVLQEVCYSMNKTRLRVPRTEKICPYCFKTVPAPLKKLYYRYEYAQGAAPSLPD